MSVQKLIDTVASGYQLYLLGNQLHDQGTPESYRRTSAAYTKAIAEDPGYAAAYAGLAVTEQEGYRFTDRPLTPADIAGATQRAMSAAELGEARRTLTRALEISAHGQHAHNYLV